MFYEALGNFLSGMETNFTYAKAAPAEALGNFLSGMETHFGVFRNFFYFTLETSLVEWKLSIPWENVFRSPALETSLVEWKLGIF